VFVVHPASKETVMPTLDEQIAELTRGALEVINIEELRAKLARGQPLIVKLGADPTAPDLHLGHSVVLTALRRFQDLGHRVNFLIGDFTGAIGDPSGRNSTRPQLTRTQIDAAAATYAQQVAKVLRPDTIEVVYNSTWFAGMAVADFIALASHWTIARMLERDDFAKRFASHDAIAMHELLYPLVQGYDSVAMRADVELGGSDQRFNLLVGRGLQRDYGQEPQVVIMLPLLVGTDGVEKMSKSKGNAVGIAEAPTVQVAKTMGIPDAAMWQWYELIGDLSESALSTLRASVAGGESSARDAKLALARSIVSRYHDDAAATAAVEEYERKARGGEPDAMPKLALAVGATVVDALVASGLASSRTRASNDLANNAIVVAGVRTKDNIVLAAGTHVIRSGKNRFVRVTIR
jgi:tyrosyl-tRNA synthetase